MFKSSVMKALPVTNRCLVVFRYSKASIVRTRRLSELGYVSPTI